MLLTMKWHAETEIAILNVYAPNHSHENEQFWTRIQTAFEENAQLRKPDIMLGDFNVVEDALDRLPAKDDPPGPQESLRNLLSALQLHDGWRITEPTTRDYSFPQRRSATRSRLDRIYLRTELLNQSFDWEITSTTVPTDHRMVCARMSTAAAPYIGKGRWTMPLTLLADQNFIKEAIDMGMKAYNKAVLYEGPDTRTESDNPQTILREYKDRVRDLARNIQKKKVPKLESAARKIRMKLTSLRKDPDIEHDLVKQREADEAQERLQDLERRREGLVSLSSATKYALNGERISKYWSKLNKGKTPRDLFFALRRPNEGQVEYETRSDRMAELARNYHEKLQLDGIPDGESEELRQQNIQDALSEVNTHLDEEQATHLGSKVTRPEVVEALRKSAPGKATGVDGIPYEFWTALDAQWRRDEGAENSFDCLALLSLVYSDVETYGTSPNAGFADGWMCPLYKKKDRREIANYRPITLLNSDYKIYTKILAMRLATVVTDIVHPDQAGFIPGRQISDQTQTCRTMIDYAEATEENGVIVALDQEKAYDKVAHDYLWAALARFGIPDAFIDKLKALYSNANTVVILNGETSSPFRVTRGVRQGDPLSCLIFDIAIEPLACALRTSDLKGFCIPGAERRHIASLFADDTSTFLSSDDDWAELWRIIARWCSGSRARFNRDKTEVIPIGTPEYRTQVATHRRLSTEGEGSLIPDSVHIAADGEAVRVLGAWIGNNVDQVATWAPVLQKIDSFLARWGRCHPTLTGKKNIIQMGPGGISQYLTTVQGMPKSVERTINMRMRAFLWNGARTSPVSMDTLCLPVEEGGLGLLDIEARNEALDLMWMKRYLDLSPRRPVWAWAMDVLISKSASSEAGAITRAAQINTFLQDWKPSLGPRTGLPPYLKRNLLTAKKHNVSFAAIKLSRRAKESLPIWYHMGALKKLRRMNNTVRGKCLRSSHKVRVVADLLPLRARHATDGEESPSISQTVPIPPCHCNHCEEDRRGGCRDPRKCCEFAAELLEQVKPKWHPDHQPPGDELTLTTRRKTKNITAKLAGEDVTFDPSVTSDSPLEEAFRAFVDPATHDCPPAIR